MPEVIPIIGLVISGITAGKSLFGGHPSAPKIPTGPQPLSAQQNAAQTASVSQSLPTLQALTGGSLSPEYAAEYGAGQTGLNNDPRATGNIQAAINSFFGLVAPGTTGLTSGGSTSGGTTSIIDLLNKGGAGGGGGGSSSSGGGGGLIDSLFSGDTFHGLAA